MASCRLGPHLGPSVTTIVLGREYFHYNNYYPILLILYYELFKIHKTRENSVVNFPAPKFQLLQLSVIRVLSSSTSHIHYSPTP